MNHTRRLVVSAVRRSTSRSVFALSLGLLASCGVGEPAAPAAPEASTTAALSRDRGGDDHPNPALFERDDRPYGRSMEYWAEQWWRWVYSTPAATNPFLNPGLDGDQNQSGPVFFLAPGNRTSTVPRHRAIAVPASTLANDYPCPDPTFKPAPGQSLFDFLLSGIKPVNDAVVEIDATLDGQVLTGLLGYRFASDDLSWLTGDLSLQTTLDGCITGSRQPMVVDAYQFIIKPLAPGHHVLTTKVVNQAGEVFAHTHELDVQ